MTNFITPLKKLFGKSDTNTTVPVNKPVVLHQEMPELPLEHETLIRLKLDEYAYVEAGKNNGEPAALKTNLNHIVSGRLLDERAARQNHERTRERLQQQREDIRAKKTEPQTKLNLLRDHLMTDLQQKIRKKESELNTIDQQAEELVLQSGYSPFRLFIYTVVWVGLTGFIYILYSSAIYAAFFRDIQAEINQLDESGNGISELFNTAFSRAALFSGIPGVYIAPFLFMGFAVWISIRERKLKKVREAGTADLIHSLAPLLAVFAALAADFIIAWRVESEAQQLRIINGIGELSPVYASLMFWGIFILGFGGYMAWKGIYEAIIEEKSLNNLRVLAAHKKIAIQKEIALLEKDVLSLRKEESDLELMLLRLNHELNKIDILIERTHRGLGDLNHSMDAFYRGWTRFVSGHPDKEILLTQCQDVYEQYRQAFQAWQPVRQDHFLFN